MAELLAEGMGESLVFVACCTGVARTGAHNSVAAMSSFLRLSIDEVLLGFSIPRSRGKLALSSLHEYPSGNWVPFRELRARVLKSCSIARFCQLPKSIQAAYLNRINPSGSRPVSRSKVNIF